MNANPHLLKIIADEIGQSGHMSIARFMELALYHPQYGYYTNGNPIGRGGDFITAPEISQIFGELIGAWIADIWVQMGQPNPFQIVECGAGRGTMLLDILRVLESTKGNILDAAHIRIIECSPTLKELQRKSLKKYKVFWHDSIDAITDSPTIIIGNEFLDALPIRQFLWSSDGWHERVVVNKNVDNSGIGALRFSYEKTNAPEPFFLPSVLRMNQIYEISEAQYQFMIACAERLKKAGGAALFIDYGYTKNIGGDTLQALRDHAYSNPLEYVGDSDLTAHVNFEFLDSVAKTLGLRTHGVRGQGQFLLDLGYEARMNALKNTAASNFDTKKRADLLSDLDAAYRRLIHPAHMGTLFKAICFSYGFDNIRPAGFGL